MATNALDNARDLISDDPAAAHLQLASAVGQIIAHAFLGRGNFSRRTK